ncbi:G-protein coupled receptor C02B8.5 [Biomphalaria glabrata]|nr:putative G-protein coupled receptor C02B8.5 [Biomphalaria glabrata]KAI8750571.1 G-protein coupled receptor C02B8.5 [Biomphalaria glabrata]
MSYSQTTESNYFLWPHINFFPFNDISGKDFLNFERAMTTFVIPTVSAVGIVGNLINIVVLYRGKCNKSSTLLILALAVADTVYLFGTNNIAMEFYHNGSAYGFEYTETLAEFLYYLVLIELVLEVFGKISSLMLPAVITLDRLVAVVSPFQYPRIMTLNRARLAIGFVYLFAVLDFLLYSVKYSFVYAPSPTDNSTMVGLIGKSSFYNNHQDVYELFILVPVYLFGPVPLLFTLLGCMGLGILIRMQEKNRNSMLSGTGYDNKNKCWNQIYHCIKHMFHQSLPKQLQLRIQLRYNSSTSLQSIKIVQEETNTKAPIKTIDLKSHKDQVSKVKSISYCNNDILTVMSRQTDTCVQQSKDLKKAVPSKPNTIKKMRQWRTTKTLLSVCIVYCLANMFNFLGMRYFHDPSLPTNMAMLVEKLRKLVLVINSACNFLFYVGFNRNYKGRYPSIISFCFKMK